MGAFYVVPETSKAALTDLMREVTYPKAHILSNADCVEESIYFMKTGVVRAYAETDLIRNQPKLHLRVQLGYIASYLGMSQVSLSRVRANMR